MNLEARFFSPEEYDAEQHNNPLEQGMTPVDILRPEDDTYLFITIGLLV